MKKQASRLVICCLGLVLQLTPIVNAQSSTVGPAFLRMTVSTSAQQTNGVVTITNDSTLQQVYEVSVVDVDIDTGSLVPLPSVSAKNQQLFSVSNSVVVEPLQKKELTVTATNFEGLAPGGHYAGVQLKQKLQGQPVGQVPLQQAVVVGLFLTKENGALRTVTLLSAPPTGVRFTLPKTQEIQLRNDGNVDITPRGFYALSRGTQEISKVQFNETSRPIFAGKTQSYTANIASKEFLLPGKYTVYVSYRADAEQPQQVASSTFWYVPFWFVLVLCVVGALLLVKTIRRIHSRKYKIAPPKAIKSDEPSTAETPPSEVIQEKIPEAPKRITTGRCRRSHN